MEVALSPTINVTQHAIPMVVHFSHNDQLKGLEGCRAHSIASLVVSCVEANCDEVPSSRCEGFS